MDNQHRHIKGYRELNEHEITAMNEVKQRGIELGELIEQLKTNSAVQADLRWVAIGTTHLQEGLMALTRAIAKPTFFIFALLLLNGCITAKKELNGRYTKVAQVENRSLFGTNQGFARLERCDGPEKKVLWFSESDFTNCVYLTHADQNEYEAASSRGAGPEIISAVIIGSSLGTGAALSGGGRAVSSSSAVASPMVNIRKHY